MWSLGAPIGIKFHEHFLCFRDCGGHAPPSSAPSWKPIEIHIDNTNCPPTDVIPFLRPIILPYSLRLTSNPPQIKEAEKVFKSRTSSITCTAFRIGLNFTRPCRFHSTKSPKLALLEYISSIRISYPQLAHQSVLPLLSNQLSRPCHLRKMDPRSHGLP